MSDQEIKKREKILKIIGVMVVAVSFGVMVYQEKHDQKLYNALNKPHPDAPLVVPSPRP